MFGFKLSWLFRNRWFALLWAVAICWMAAEFATPPEPDAAGQTDALGMAINPEDVKKLQDALK